MLLICFASLCALKVMQNAKIMSSSVILKQKIVVVPSLCEAFLRKQLSQQMVSFS